jgi:hypothetical protein
MVRMLRNVSAEVAECHRHAEECAQRAKAAPTPQARDDFLFLERSWLKLAQSIEAGERLTAFTQSKKKPK